MFDSSSDVTAYHDQKVTLRQSERTDMRDRRDNARERLKRGLKDNNNPLPERFVKQGSYAMLTMVQDGANDYDIDDGVYYKEEALKDDEGNCMEPKAVREMVCKALKGDERFSKEPAAKKSCVRIFYSAGYHIDLPVYRILEKDGDYELAAGDSWVRSRAADVENWFNETNANKSPDDSNGRQFRRIVRMLKKFARSRDSWKSEIASGFTITKLAEEKYVASKDRDDKALRDTMQRIHDRLLFDLEVSHPITPGSRLTSGPDDSTTAFLREKLKKALEDLEVLDRQDCTAKEAAKAWDKVFNTDFFTNRLPKEASEKASTVVDGIFAKTPDPRVVDKNNGGRYA